MTGQQPDYSKCWAQCLGDCGGPMSREHIVSKCLYGQNVKVKGLPWCKVEWSYRSIDNLTSKILCKDHNSRLSDVDDGARHTLDTIIDAFALWNLRSRIINRRWTVRHFATDMLLLERWCLKTLINTNLNLKPGWPIKGDSPNLTDELVRITFGMERFKRPMGLYVVGSEQPEQRTVNLDESEITIVIPDRERKVKRGNVRHVGIDLPAESSSRRTNDEERRPPDWQERNGSQVPDS